PHGLDPGPRRLDPKQARWLATLDTAPELLLGGQQQVLVKRVRWDGDLDPFAPSGDHREHRGSGIRDPHVVLDLGHVLLGGALFRERPRQHELGLENGPGGFDDAVERCPHPPHYRMANSALDIFECLAAIAFEPEPIEGLGRDPELDDEVPGEVRWLDLA